LACGASRKLGVEIYPGFPAHDLIVEDNVVKDVVTGDLGVAREGHHKAEFQPGIELRGKYSLFTEGARGSLSKVLGRRFGLHEGREPQKFGLGFKELWEISPEQHREGLVVHGFGWPLQNDTGGGLFMYHWGERYCSIGFVVHLNYHNPWLEPFSEIQRAKTHPAIRSFLEGCTRGK
jgi:electron-transferring-flavoprotein dehydrogenase